ncbi:MAG: hypothetical protein QOE46_3038 [Acidobacteriota bacterium]|jgi:hypothetical protein|nr:hypothetical protein [Acidobacteriota bacterium]
MAATKSRKKTAAQKAKATATKTKATGAKKSAAVAAKKAKPASRQSAKAPANAKAKAGASKVKKGAAAKSRKAGAAKTSSTKASKEKASQATKKSAAKQSVPNARAAKTKAAKDVLDFEGFPAGSVTRHDVTLCLACIFRLFTNQMGLAPRTAYNEIRRYAPTVEELTAREPQRPFFKPSPEKNPHCPYCDAPKRWHALVSVYRVEGAHAARRALLRALPTKDEQFQIQEERKTARQVFFEWLERLGEGLDFREDVWMIAAARAYLERREPKTDWAEAFGGVRVVRRSQRLGEGFEREGARLFLAPALYNDVLLVQYLVSRSQAHGGLTSEGRLTLIELVRRMRYGGHLEASGITDRDQFDVLEQLVERLTGGDDPARLHFITDRRDLLDKVKDAAGQ